MNLLQGERLQDSIGECIQEVSERGLKAALEEMRTDTVLGVNAMLPDILYDSVDVVGLFALGAAGDDHLRSIYLKQEITPSFFATLYFGLTLLQRKAYKPSRDLPIPGDVLPAFIQLLQANPTSAALSTLTMYSIRHHTITKRPEAFDILFRSLSYSEKLSYDIGKKMIPSLSGLRLILSHRRSASVESTYSNQIPRLFHLD